MILVDDSLVLYLRFLGDKTPSFLMSHELCLHKKTIYFKVFLDNMWK